MKVMIAGGGIAGFTLGLLLEKRGIRAHIFESAPSIEPLGLGINLLPHCTKVLKEADVLEAIAAITVHTKEMAFFNRFGQHVYSEPVGLDAGYDLPQLSVHRGDVQLPMLKAFTERAGADHVHTGHHCTGFEQDGDQITAHFQDPVSGKALPSHSGDILVASDGIHSVLRKALHPEEGDPIYSGVTMWRGATVLPPFLSGASMTRVGWLTTGKMVIYPIRDNVDGKGGQLINWVAEIETDRQKPRRDWNKPGRVEDFIASFEGMKFDWLDIPGMIRATDTIYEFPMVDQEALPFWSQGRITLMGDAAHPMYPRGSNGAGQAILDAKCLADLLGGGGDPLEALKAYEAERLPATRDVVLANRKNPPDVILKMVFERTGDKPFDRVEDVVTREELAAVTANYRKVAGYDKSQLK